MAPADQLKNQNHWLEVPSFISGTLSAGWISSRQRERSGVLRFARTQEEPTDARDARTAARGEPADPGADPGHSGTRDARPRAGHARAGLAHSTRYPAALDPAERAVADDLLNRPPG
jgi:hypothetical protein